MVVALWRPRHRGRTAMDAEPVRRGPLLGVFGYRLAGRDLLAHGAGGLPFRQRRHGRTGSAGRDRRLVFLVAAAEADIGEPLQQRQLLVRMLLLGLMGLTDF